MKLKITNKNGLIRKIIFIFLGLILLPILTLKLDYFNNDNVYFAFYNGNEKLNSMPLKDNEDNIVFSYAKCDNGASVMWNDEEWAPLVKNLSKSKTKCSLYFREYNAADYIKDLANSDTTNILADDTNDENIRYVGASPNNYIDIGDGSLWRIIGVMNNITNLDNEGEQESLVKIIRADSIGTYSYDSSESGINNGYGVNEWSQADIMKLLNPQDVYKEIPVIGKSLYWNGESGSCYNDVSETNIPCEFTSSGISDEAKKKIAKVRWNTGTSIEMYNITKKTAKYMYEAERNIYNGKQLCENKGLIRCNDEIERKTTWDGYIGLIYPSDYGYAIGGTVRNTCLENDMYYYKDNSCNTNDWLKPKVGWIWTMSPAADTSSAVSTYLVYSTGSAYRDSSYYPGTIYPVAFLKSNIKILPNSNPKLEYGSIENPFKTSL